jgi:hypothetical protein
VELHKDSHTDHVPADVLEYVLALFKERSGFFIETVELPTHLSAVRCDLHGPAVKEPPVLEDEVWWGCRGERPYESRLCRRPPNMTRVLTVIAGPHDGLPCVLFTVFGGPVAPREVMDPNFKTLEEVRQSEEFWAEHALSQPAPFPKKSS